MKSPYFWETLRLAAINTARQLAPWLLIPLAVIVLAWILSR